jgi:GT2 family glycosyltransferase
VGGDGASDRVEHRTPASESVSRVTVVIPTWNGRELLDAALASLREQRFRDFEVVVVDNGSTDGTVEHLREAEPEVEVLALPENHGFAGAVNAGIGRAHGDYVALLNNDMELDPGWLAELVAALDADPRAGSAASKLRMLREPGVLDGAGDIVTWYGATWRRGHGEPDRGQYDEPGIVASPCAGAALYRRRALDEVGGFDERFFAYLEDADWGLRAQLAGWPCLWVPAAVAYHLGGATSRRMGDLETELIARNTLALVLKSFPAWRLVVWSPLIVAYQGWVLGQAVGRGSWRAVLRGWSAALRSLPATLRARGEVRRRTRERAALARVVTARVVRRG